MNMNCPNTPTSVISGMLKKEQTMAWQSAWKVFVEIYYSTMLAMAKNEFSRFGWTNTSDDEIEEVISATTLSIIDVFKKGKYEKGHKFRGFLKRIISRRVVDYIRTKNRKRTLAVESTNFLDAINNSDLNIDKSDGYYESLEENESIAYRKSVVLDAWENIRPAFSSQTALIFEMSYLENRPIGEILTSLGVDRKKVDNALHRVIKKLKQKVNEEDYRKELEK